MPIADAHNLLASGTATADELIDARALVKSELRAVERQPTVNPGSGSTREQVAEIRQAQAEREEQVETLTELHSRLHNALQQRLAADALEEGEKLAGQIAEGLHFAEKAKADYRAQVQALVEKAEALAECKKRAPELGLSGDALRRLMAMEPVQPQHRIAFERSVRA